MNKTIIGIGLAGIVAGVVYFATRESESSADIPGTVRGEISGFTVVTHPASDGQPAFRHIKYDVTGIVTGLVITIYDKGGNIIGGTWKNPQNEGRQKVMIGIERDYEKGDYIVFRWFDGKSDRELTI